MLAAKEESERKMREERLASEERLKAEMAEKVREKEEQARAQAHRGHRCFSVSFVSLLTHTSPVIVRAFDVSRRK